MAPLVADGKVLVGNSGGEMGVRGWIAALDEGSGKLAWKAYNTGPDKDVLIGPRLPPLLCVGPRHRSRRQELAAGRVEDRRRHRLGLAQLRPRDADWSSTASAIPARGTPTSGPATTSGRPASSPATSTPARRAGSTRSTPHDLFDHDDINEIILADMPMERRGAAGHAPARRATASSTCRTAAPARCCPPTPFGYVNAYRGVDLKTGRIIPNREKARRRAG